MRNKGAQIQKLKLQCDETLCKATSSDKESDIGFYCGWLSAMCLVYLDLDKIYFSSLQEKITKLLIERRML